MIQLETLSCLEVQPGNPAEGRNRTPNLSAIIPGIVASLDLYIDRHRAGLDTRPFRGRQVTVFEAMRNFLRDGGTEGYVKLPSGVGKTVLFTKFIDATRLRTLIVTDRILSINQTGEKLEAFAEGLDVGKIHHAVKEFGREVTIITYASFRINIENKKLNPEDYPLLILDEFDRAGPRTTEAIKEFTNSIKLGFSATVPSRTSLKEIHKMTIKEAVQEGLISPLSVFIAQPNVDLTNIVVDSTGEYNESELGKAINIAKINQPAAELYRKMFIGQSALVFCSGIEHARTVSRLFAKNGIPAGFISGKMRQKEQLEILSQFRKGEIKVLCSADLLTRAYDEPRASVCLNLRPTFSPVLAEQRGGRVLRNDPNDPQKHACIVDFLYELRNPKRLPVSFAQVAESANITTAENDEGKKNSWETARKRTIRFKGKEKIIDNKKIDISGLKIIIDAKEVLRVVKGREAEKKPAIQGWVNKLVIARIAGRSYPLILRRMALYREKYPQWVQKVVDGRGKESEVYAPELVEKVIREVTGIRPAPSGWQTKNNLAVQIRVGRRTIERIVWEKETQRYPQLTGRYLDTRGTPRNFLSPELVRQIKRRLRKI